jgi:hypothetical protein
VKEALLLGGHDRRSPRLRKNRRWQDPVVCLSEVRPWPKGRPRRIAPSKEGRR